MILICWKKFHLHLVSKNTSYRRQLCVLNAGNREDWHGEMIESFLKENATFQVIQFLPSFTHPVLIQCTHVLRGGAINGMPFNTGKILIFQLRFLSSTNHYLKQFLSPQLKDCRMRTVTTEMQFTIPRIAICPSLHKSCVIVITFRIQQQQRTVQTASICLKDSFAMSVCIAPTVTIFVSRGTARIAATALFLWTASVARTVSDA